METTRLTISGDLEDREIQSLARGVVRSLRRESDVEAELAEENAGPGARGDAITLGTIAITFLTSGSAVALFNILKSYLDRNSSLDVRLKRADGAELELSAENVKAGQVEKTLRQVQDFFEVE